MIEAGLVDYIQTGLTSLSITVPGGFFGQMSKDTMAQYTQAWTYRTIFKTPLYTLAGMVSLTKWEVQIDCHGTTPDLCQALAYGIQHVLRGGFQGTFSDSDSTKVDAIFQLPGSPSGINDETRTWVQSLEYDVFYYQV